MSQHLLSLGDDQLALIDRALTDLETQLAPPPTFHEDRFHLDLEAIPPSPKRPGMLALAALDPLRRRLQRLQRLIQYARDAELIHVNEALNHSLKGHAACDGSGQRFEQPHEPPQTEVA